MDPVGDFYVHVLNRNEDQTANAATAAAANGLISSKWLITQVGGGKPAVIHFYDGG